ncbi:MAG: asparagine synthase B [Bdellovibrionaceae bacterium]|nr:asparagine synthase B [Pseudobdellovibrionaceae bacterium]
MCGFMTGPFAKGDEQQVENEFQRIQYRGPDHSNKVWFKDHFIGFHRLAIMDLSPSGHQPFVSQQKHLVCNGEIYNYKGLAKQHDLKLHSNSDCEVILPLIEKFGLQQTCLQLDGEYAFVMFDEQRATYVAARDPMGVRPLFYGKIKNDKSCRYAFASEVKSLSALCEDIKPFPPGHYFDGKEIKPYLIIEEVKKFSTHSEKEVLKNIRDLFIEAVNKRLDSDAPLGFLLSGGLDSSLVCSIATKILKKPITTFAVGINEKPIDTKYAQVVAEYIGSKHHEVLFKKEDIFRTLHDLIYRLETYDITSIRASMGMSLLCEYIQKETDVKVLLTGEVSDELFGYKYTDFAPNAYEFQKESEKRIKELYMYDILRADRCIASNSLEARVPFSDTDFVQYALSINPELKMNSTGVGKHLLRKAFEGDFLPQDILYREKAAFSDAVGHSVVDYLVAYAATQYSDKDLFLAQVKYEHATPRTKEALLYREIFESRFTGQSQLVKDFWLPNRDWENCDVEDPSARVLPNYGASGV